MGVSSSREIPFFGWIERETKKQCLSFFLFGGSSKKRNTQNIVLMIAPMNLAQFQCAPVASFGAQKTSHPTQGAHIGGSTQKFIWLWLKKPVPKCYPGEWKHGPKPAVCPSWLILSHTQYMFRFSFKRP